MERLVPQFHGFWTPRLDKQADALVVSGTCDADGFWHGTWIHVFTHGERQDVAAAQTLDTHAFHGTQEHFL